MRNYNKYKKVKTRKKSFNPYMILAMFAVLIIAMSVGYGAFSDTLTISGTANARYTNYYINYELDGGTNPSNPVSTFTIADDLPLPIPTKSNYNFDGWYLYSDFSGSAVTTTSDINVLTLNPANDTVLLYAKWSVATVTYTITYNNITGSNNYPSTISSGSTYTQNFTTPPDDVSVTMGGTNLTKGTDFTYSNGTLTIPNVTGNLVINGVSASGGEYDPNNLQEGTHIYASSPGAPQVTVENGVVTEYTFTDTSGYNTASAGIDTGFIPFTNGKDFELYIRANYPASTNASTIGCLLDVRDRALSSSTYSLQVAYSTGASAPTLYIRGTNPNGSSSQTQKNLSLVNNILDLKITYKSSTGTFTVVYNGTNYSVDKYLSLDDLSIYIGYTINTSGNVIRRANATVYEFYVKEI